MNSISDPTDEIKETTLGEPHSYKSAESREGERRARENRNYRATLLASIFVLGFVLAAGVFVLLP